jgi:ABC-type lipoprotein release transport system permease subunit
MLFRNFSVISKISVRNLVRQRKRNILLGICIAVGMAILVLTSSFTAGLSDIIFNKLMVLMTGHITVQGLESTHTRTEVVRDAPRLVDLINKNVDGVVSVDQMVTSTTFGRAIGNKKTALVMPIGLPEKGTYLDDLTMEAGKARDVFKDDLYTGVLLYKSTADELNLKLGDLVDIKTETIFKQPNRGTFKVVGIIRSENMFMDMASYFDEEKLRPFLNMQGPEKISLNIIVNYPGDIVRIIQQTDRLYKALQENVGPASLKGTLAIGAQTAPADVFALELKNDPNARELARHTLEFTAGSFEGLVKNEKGVVLTEPLAQRLKASVGAPLNLTYALKYEKTDPMTKSVSKTYTQAAVVAGIVKPPAGFSPETAFAHDGLFYEFWFWSLPAETASFAPGAALANALLPEWEMTARTPDTETSMKKMQKLYRDKWYGTKLDVSSMFETAKMMLDMQGTLNLISIIAVAVLFIVIVIGVVNTMRMTIRERTREIGTNRAIGMQRRTVRAVFVFEIVYLSIAACVVGLLLGFGLMFLFSQLTIDAKDNVFSMFLPKQHLYFLADAWTLLGFFVLIVLFTLVISFFTARRASRLIVADALRHYE